MSRSASTPRSSTATAVERTVLLAGHGESGDGGRVDRVQGYLVDLTDARRDASRDDVQEALAGALDHRAVIEQAKGVLMLAHGVDADESFALLRAYSQDHNVKVRDLADRLVDLVAKDGRPDEGFLRKVLQIFDVELTDVLLEYGAPRRTWGIETGRSWEGAAA